jgi:hypothetical protein
LSVAGRTEALSAALDDLDPGDRALLELSLQRGMSDRNLASALGTDAGDIGKRRNAAVRELADKLGWEPADVESTVRELPVGAVAEGEDDDERAKEDAAAALHGGESRRERDEESRVGFFRSNGLSIFFLVIFLAAVGAQSFAGWHKFNEDRVSHHEHSISYGRYVTSSEFGQAVTENWQSEYLQFVLYFMATIWFVQRGSPESKKWRDRGRQSEEDQALGEYARPDSPAPARRARGLLRALYSNSLLIWMAAIWVASWFAQSVTGWSAYNSNQLAHKEAGTNWVGYIQSADFWEATLQNWQSEFLAVGSMAIFAVYLRQRGSPESKPVGAPHDETASTG